MSIINKIISLFKPQNFILIIGLLLNISIMVLVLYIPFYLIFDNNMFTMLLIFVALYIVIDVFMSTSAGDIILMSSYQIKRLNDDKDNKKYYKLLDNAKKQFNTKRFKKIYLSVIERDYIDSYAIGTTSICLTKKALEESQEVIEALIIRELINIKNGNGLMRNLVLEGNVILKMILSVLLIPLYIIGWIIDYVVTFIKYKRTNNPVRYSGKVISAIYNILTGIFGIGVSFTQFIRSFYIDKFTLKKIKKMNLNEKLVIALTKMDIKNTNKGFSLFDQGFVSNMNIKKQIEYLND